MAVNNSTNKRAAPQGPETAASHLRGVYLNPPPPPLLSSTPLPSTPPANPFVDAAVVVAAAAAVAVVVVNAVVVVVVVVVCIVAVVKTLTLLCHPPQIACVSLQSVSRKPGDSFFA